MGTYGDKPLSRFKWRRIRRRLLYFIAGTIVVTVGLIVAALFLLKSETFWRRYILSSYFGPYWETSVSWDNFSPRVFPPGLHVENLRLHEPNEESKIFLQVDEADFRGTLRTGLDYVDLQVVDIDGVTVNFVRYGADDSNLKRIVRRLFRGKRPSDVGTRMPESRTVIPEIITPSEFEISNVTVRFEDRSNPESIFSWSYAGKGPVDVDVYTPRGETRGRLDQLFQANSLGEFRISTPLGPIPLDVRSVVSARDLSNFPDCEVWISATVTPPDQDTPVTELDFSVPLDRTPVRVQAAQIQNVELKLKEVIDGEPLLELSKTQLDPLTGDISGEIRGDFRPRKIHELIAAYLPGSHQDLWRRQGEETLPGAFFLSRDSAHPLQASIRFQGKGVGQYAITDPEERVSMDLRLSTALRARDVKLGTIRSIHEALYNGREIGSTGDEVILGTIDAEGDIHISESGDFADLAVDARVLPTNLGDEPTTLTLRLSAASDSNAPARIQPLPPLAAAITGEGLLRFGNRPLVIPVVPSLKDAREETVNGLNRLQEFLEDLQVADASLVQVLDIEESSLLTRLLSPVIEGVSGSSRAQFRVSLQQLPAERYLRWREEVAIEQLGVENLAGYTNVDSDFTALIDGSRLDIIEACSVLERLDDGAGKREVASLELARSRRGQLGPLESSFIDYATDTGHIAVEAEGITPAVLSFLSRLRLYGASEYLNLPFSLKLQRAAGLMEQDGEETSTADIFFEFYARHDFEFLVSASFDNFPWLTFLGGDQLGNPPKSANVLLENSFRIDRAATTLSLDTLLLEASRPEDNDLMTRLSFTTEEPAVFDLEELGDYTSRLTEKYAAEQMPGIDQPEQFVLELFKNIETLQDCLRQGKTRFSITSPGMNIGDWRNALQAASIPLDSGRLFLHLASELADEGDMPRANGEFTLRDARIRGIDSPVEVVRGSFQLSEDDERLYLDSLSASGTLDDSTETLEVAFSGWRKLESAEFYSKLHINNLSPTMLHALREAHLHVIQELVAVLSYLPGSLARSFSPESERTGLTIELSRGSSDSGMVIEGQQTTEGLRLLSSVLPTLGSRTSVRLQERENSLLLEQMDSSVYEAQSRDDLMTLALESPVQLAAESSEAVPVRFNVSLDSQSLKKHLSISPYPVFARLFSTARTTGTLTVTIPASRLSEYPESAQSNTYISVDMDNLSIAGLDGGIQGNLTAIVKTAGDSLKVDDGILTLYTDQNIAGTLEFSVDHPDNASPVRGKAELLDITHPLLGVLPAPVASWFGEPTAALSARSDLLIDKDEEEMVLDISLTGSGILPPGVPQVAGNSAPPRMLRADAGVVLTFDHPTSHLLVQELSGFVIPAESNVAESLAEPLIRFSQTNPFAYELGKRRFSDSNSSDSGIYVGIGPVDLAEYGYYLTEVAGLSFTSGILRGEGRIQPRGGQGALPDKAELEFTVSEGQWLHQDETTEPIEMDFYAVGGGLENVIRLDEVDLQLYFPDAPESRSDRLRLEGFYREQLGDDMAELQVTSDGLTIDRVLVLASDIQHNLREAAIEPRGKGRPGIWRRLGNIDARVVGDLQEVRFREITSPRIATEARLYKESLTVKEVRALLESGQIVLSGNVDFRDPKPRWAFHVDVENAAAQPWVDSFAPDDWRERITGILTTEFHGRGAGFTRRDLVENLEGSAEVFLREAYIDDEQFVEYFGEQRDLELNGEIFLNNNAVRMRLDTPWHPERDLFLQGTIRPIIPENGKKTHYQMLADFRRTTIVGPEDRTMRTADGEEVPYRQDLYGMIMEISGAVNDDQPARIDVRTVTY